MKSCWSENNTSLPELVAQNRKSNDQKYPSRRFKKNLSKPVLISLTKQRLRLFETSVSVLANAQENLPRFEPSLSAVCYLDLCPVYVACGLSAMIAQKPAFSLFHEYCC